MLNKKSEIQSEWNKIICNVKTIVYSKLALWKIGSKTFET